MLRAFADLEGDIVTSKRSQSMRLGLRFKPELLREAYDAVVFGSGPAACRRPCACPSGGGKVAVFEPHSTACGVQSRRAHPGLRQRR
jgi:hypothetical protein